MKPSEKKDLARLVKGLSRYQSFLLTCHVTPEGDAIGSMLAMESLLRRMGKKTRIVCQDPFPERLPCLSRRRWLRTCDLGTRIPSFDAVVLTDCPSLARVGDVVKLIRPDSVIFNIDHHVSNTRFGRYNFVRPEAAATAEVVLDIFETLKFKPTRDEAKSLYVGLATDTGSFKYGNTRAKSHLAAAELISAGINIEKINDDIHGSYSLKTIKLYERLFGRVKTAAEGAVAWASLRRLDLEKAGANDEDAEGFIDFVRYIKGVKIAFFISELPDGQSVRVSFRARGAYDVNRLATHFNGGGHRKSAGCKIKARLEDAEQQIVQRILKTFRF
ncbi:MAG: bifunctional oligoribonuclease/PAP phosphatase NrnA [Candidatus Omnitrophica bacterium]|nr:bifunctional oligoribonuclease/PAP phosphatase NrnA [Candidatus Omnitrophota bacterium]